MTHVPTIMIGLGGLGSYIVDTIYGWIPEEKRKSVAIHAFDTNINDISKLKNLGKDNVTQTSTNWTVAEYLRMAEGDSTVKDWFPLEHSELKRKSLTDGAGQIRVVSRLAYRAAMESGKLNKLHNSINHIFQETGSDMASSARVMIVSSLMGGTGAGIFLQTAMYMRDVLENDFQRRNVLIRGAFMLPDTLVLTGTIKGNEVENIRANAYACMKELNAITRNASVDRGKNLVSIELEYKPNQIDSHGRLAHTIGQDNLPYNFLYLFDFENTEKNNLKHFRNYINQVSRATYLDLFSPMSNDRFSKQDNQILSMIASNGMSRYCGAGVSSLIYPYEDIVYYFALRWSSDSLSKEWLKIDEQYESDYRDYERDLKSGIPREKPLLRDRYRDVLFRLATQQNPRPFFKMAYREAHTIDKRGDISRSKAELFLENVERRIDSIINGDSKLQEFSAECAIDENRLSDAKTARDEVSRREEALYFYEQTVRKFIDNTRNYVVNEIVLQDGDHPELLSGDDYKLNTWMLKSSEPMHPVTVRYMLYEIDNLLTGKLKELNPKNEKLGKSLERYKTIYDLDETDDYVETADDRLASAGKQGFFGRMLSNQFKEFIDEYLEKSSRHFSNLNRYRKDRLMESVYKELLNAIREMQEGWEKYFKNLKDTQNSLINELDILSNKHDFEADPTINYVLGSRKMKEKMWEVVRTGVAGDSFPAEIAGELYKGQYRRFVKRRKGDYITEQRPEKVEEMFRKDVLGWCLKEMKNEDALDLNCVRALRREAEMNGMGDDQIHDYIKSKISVLNNLARPWVPSTNGTTELNAWGVNPDCIKELSGDMQNELFDGTDLVDDPAFSRYQIIRNRTVFGMTINDFRKFYCGDNKGIPPGEYYKAYNNRIRKLTKEGNTVTPHLDKRWHLQAYLPEIHSERVQEDRSKVDRALLWGIVMGYLENIDEWGQLTWLFDDSAGSRIINEGNKPADRFVHTLHKALLHNPIIVDKIMERVTEQFSLDASDYRDQIQEHTFYKKAQEVHYFEAKPHKTINIVDLLLRYPEGDPSNFDLITKSNDLLKLLLEELVNHYVSIHGSYRERIGRAKAMEFIEHLFETSPVYKEVEQYDSRGSRFRAWTNLLNEVRKANR